MKSRCILLVLLGLLAAGPGAWAETKTVAYRITGATQNGPGSFSDGAYWCTFYDGTNRYTLPEGATAYTLNSSKNLFRLGTDGRTVPAGTAVVIISDKAEFFLTQSDDTSEISINGGGNILTGLDSDLKLGVHLTVYYMLGVVDNTLGFHRFTGVLIPAHKAYYTN